MNVLSVLNNSETIYIDVLDVRQKILLLYDGPHPDISVIKQSIEINKNYEVKTSLLSDAESLKLADFSLVVLYQCNSTGSAALKGFISKSTLPVWYMLGAQTDLSQFNNSQKALQIYSNRGQMQEVFPLPTTDFSLFTLSDSTRNKLTRFPPLMAPFGNYRSMGTNKVLLNQSIGVVLSFFSLFFFCV